MDFEFDPFNDANWRFQLNALRAIDCFFSEDIVNPGNNFDISLAHMMQWIDCDNGYGDSAGYRWHDMATGLRSQKLALLIQISRLLKVDDSTLEILEDSAYKHLKMLMNPDFLSQTNHGIFQMHGLMALSKVSKGEVSRAASEYSTASILNLINSQFDDDGVHTENSPEYHFFAINILKPIIESGWYELPRINQIWDKILLESCWLIWPDGGFVEVGDSNNSSNEPKIRRWQREKMDMIDNRTMASQLEINGQKFITREQRHSGYTVIRTPFGVKPEESSMLFTTSAFKSTSHRQADDLSFTIFERGGVVFSDPGKFQYGSSPGRNFVQSSHSHNCLTIDNKNFPISKDHFYNSARQWVRNYSWGFGLLLRKDWHHINTEQWRLLIYRPGEFFGVVDAINSENDREFTQWFHLSERYSKIDFPSETSFRASGGPVPINGAFISTSEEKPTISSFHGSMDPFQGWTSPTYGKLVPSFAIGSSVKGKFRVLGSIFTFNEQDPHLEIFSSDNQIRIEANIGTNEVRIPILLSGVNNR
jgi:hypothetical protein